MSASPSPRRRGRPSGLEGRDLLNAAREMFLSKGFRGTTMDGVAARARISKQSLYAAFPSKERLFAAVVEDWVDQGHDAARGPAEALAASTDLRPGLLRMAEVLQAGILSPAVLSMRTLVAAEAESLPEVAADYLHRSWDRNLDLLASALSSLSERGLLTVPDAGLAAEQFVWLVLAAPLNRLSLGAPPASAPDLRRTAEEGITTFLARFAAP